MALDFPNPPLTTGQNFTSPSGVAWTWDGVKWVTSGSTALYLPTSGGTISGSPGTLLINQNTAAVPPAAAPQAVQLNGADGHYALLQLDAHGTNSSFVVLEMARGTGAAPSAVQSGDTLGAISTRGHNGTTYNNEGTSILGVATENWTTTANGSALVFSTMANGSAGGPAAGRMRLGQGLVIGWTASDPAMGSLVLNGNTTAPPAWGAGLLINGANNTYPALQLNAYSSAAAQTGLLTFMFSRGTATAPAPPAVSDVFGFVQWNGYGAGGVATGAQIYGRAAENWSATAQGTVIGFATITPGTTNFVERMVIGRGGFVIIYVTLQVQGGRILSIGTNNPSVTCWNTTGAGYAAGIWASSANTLIFGQMDGTGTPIQQYGYFDSSNNLTVGNNINLGGQLQAASASITGSCNAGPSTIGGVVLSGTDISGVRNFNSGGTMTIGNCFPFGNNQASNGQPGQAWFQVAAYNYPNQSDPRLKDDIMIAPTGALDKVRTLPVYEFRYKGEIDNQRIHVGFNADEVEALHPHAVFTGEDEAATKAVNQPDMLALLWQAVQELSAQVDNLQAGAG